MISLEPQNPKMQAVEQILRDYATDASVFNSELFSTLYADLKRIAIGQMKREQAGHTLQSTALVHEAFLRLLKLESCNWNNRHHFFAAAAEVMRRILIDHARSKSRIKRGGEMNKRSLSSMSDPTVEHVRDDPAGERVLRLNDALKQLEVLAPVKAQVVELRFFGNLTHGQIAELLDISKTSVDRYWAFSKAWLFQQMKQTGEA